MAKKRDLRPATAKAARELLDLIERDRAAAAAQLGVPLAQSSRTPQVTADSQPQPRRVNEDSGNYMLEQPAHDDEASAPAIPAHAKSVPDIPAYPTPAPRAKSQPQPLEAPPMRGRGQAQISTAPAEPLAWSEQDDAPPRSSKRLWIVGALAAAVAAATIVVVATRGDNEPKQAATMPEDKVVMAVTQPPAPPPPVETKPQEPVETKPVDPPVETKPVATNGADVKPATGRPSTKKGDRVAVKKPETKPVETKPVETKPVEVKPVETKPVETGPMNKSTFTTRYTAVGRDLKALGEQAGDLWPSYRLIDFNKAMKNPDHFADSVKILADLTTKIAARKK
jgi:hypothetical protein